LKLQNQEGARGMSRKLIALALLFFLASCQKSDVQNCVDAQLEAFDQGKSVYAEVNEDRTSFKELAYLRCGQAMKGQINS
jgi:hypothetical protein